jgi:hypothetical protein
MAAIECVLGRFLRERGKIFGDYQETLFFFAH